MSHATPIGFKANLVLGSSKGKKSRDRVGASNLARFRFRRSTSNI